MSKRRRPSPQRFDAVPQHVRPRLQRIAVLCGALAMIAAAALLSLTAYRTGFAPLPQTYRSGTVTITGCQPQGSQLFLVQSCTARVVAWDGEPRAGAPALTDAAEVAVVSRTPLTGTVQVVSRKGMITNPFRPGGNVPTSEEVIMPADQTPLPDVVKVLLGLGCLLMAFVGSFVGGRIAWGVELRRAERSARP